MPLLRINAAADGLTLHDTPQAASRRLCAIASRPGPAIIMVHGYKYAPGTVDHCPHKKIFGHQNDNWPAALGFGRGAADEGLGIAFGWYARGPLKAVHKRATVLGAHIAVVVAMLRDHSPQRPVHLIAHSLGAEAALRALAHLPKGAIDRIILLTGASYALDATHMLNTAAGRAAEVLNVTSRENDLFDAAFEHMVPRAGPPDRAIGLGIDAPNVTTVQLDCTETLAGLKDLGFALGAPTRRICHWSAYKRPGAMAFYKSFLRRPEAVPLATLQQNLPRSTAPRWSRLFTRLRKPTLCNDSTLFRPALQVGSPPTLAETMMRSPKNDPAY